MITWRANNKYGMKQTCNALVNQRTMQLNFIQAMLLKIHLLSVSGCLSTIFTLFFQFLPFLSLPFPPLQSHDRRLFLLSSREDSTGQTGQCFPGRGFSICDLPSLLGWALPSKKLNELLAFFLEVFFQDFLSVVCCVVCGACGLFQGIVLLYCWLIYNTLQLLYSAV